MKKICLQIPKNNKYVIACSFGPDSMALLDVAYINNFNFVVAHVNYHHRDEADYEEKSLREYCEKRNICIEVLDLKNEKVEGNFEAWAREKRYNFFKEICHKQKADSVLVAHHQDDLIETYLMQKKRGNVVKKWGIAEKTEIFGVSILRPFLNFTKNNLLDYCAENKVPYSIDKTNLECTLERNKIRHEIVEKLSVSERNKIIKEIELQNDRKIEFKNHYLANDFALLPDEEITLIFDHFLSQEKEHKNISKNFINEIRKFARSKKANCKLKLSEKIDVFKCYDDIYIVKTDNIQSYCLKIEKPGKISNNFLIFESFGDSSDRNISKDDYPLTIRNAKATDIIKISDNDISVRRFFIDWKMPLFIRNMWPVVLNKDNKVIYIPRYRKNFVDNHKTKLEINIDFLLAN